MLTQGGFRNSLVGNKDDNFSQEVFWVTQMFWLKKNNNQFNLFYPIPIAPGNVRKPKLSWDWKLILFFSVLIICYAIWEALSHLLFGYHWIVHIANIFIFFKGFDSEYILLFTPNNRK